MNAETKIKMCGLSRACDIEKVNELKIDYIGFVFAKKSKRYVSPEKARELKNLLDPKIKAVGVFVDEDTEMVANLLEKGIIDIAQLHGGEDESYIKKLRSLTDKPIIQAFRIDTAEDVEKANESTADFVLLDSGNGGTGKTFDWSLLGSITRPFFLAGGLDVNNVKKAVEALAPYAVDVSSGIETNGFKDENKMTAFAKTVRNDI